MSIQGQPVCYNSPEQSSSSSIVITRGTEEYDPFAIDDDENDSEQLKSAKNQKQESIRINNGASTHPVINNTNGSSSSDKSSSLQTSEQEESRSQSPVEHHNNHRSKSPSHQNSSDRKRLRPSSPNSSTTTTVTSNDSSSNSDTISVSKYKKPYRDDDRKTLSKHDKLRSFSSSPSQSNNHNKKIFDWKDDKSSNSSYNKSSHRSEKRDEHYSNRQRNYHSYLSSKYSSSSHNERRATTDSSPSRLPSKILISDGNSSLPSMESTQNTTSTEDRNRIYNRLKNMNDSNRPVSPISNSNKTSSTGSPFMNSNGGSQHSRSNLIEIVTTEAASGSTQIPPTQLSLPQVKSDAIKPLPAPPIPTNVESKTNTTDSIQSTKTNGNTADDMLMEEMLFEEEQEQSPVKSIDIDNLTIPETPNKKPDNIEEPMKVIQTAATTLTSTVTSVPSLTPSPTKKPYTLYKVPHTNHMTPPLSARHKKQTKKESTNIQSEATPNKPTIEDNALRTSLDERISSLLGATNKPTNSSIEQQPDIRINQTTRTSTPSDKSTESPQDIPSLISNLIKKSSDHTSVTKKLTTNDDRRSTPSKHYTTEWLASQKPEEAPTEEIIALPSLVTLPTLVSSQPSVSNTKSSSTNSGEAAMLGKLTEAMSKLIQKQGDTNPPPSTTATEADDAVPISAKHLERLERRKQREKHQSEIAAIAKEALKPAFKKHDITKDEYKEIMKKVVTKATHTNEVDQIRISKMIDAYIEKYRTIRQHNTTKASNRNPS
ncbi:unnamed protein product [Rotaria magnacalcarata]|uniref:SFR19-like C-terminal domain-containing protein n=1 Tax=Rotaria magnacalcarata TaxID=392030 RepID=A0A816RQ42_9BILA|nr:unnamed protein product [Rotaria magnacalcarata]CAF2179861.1 unnamed protein product [Rotaria magnacalcarata]CAF3764239.1 unnamed protein product [Rotaria magnacalcarata]